MKFRVVASSCGYDIALQAFLATVDRRDREPPGEFVMSKQACVLCCAATLTMFFPAQVTSAASMLQITEIYSGISNPNGGQDITEDWFEVTNLGDASWELATDGSLNVEDEPNKLSFTVAITLPNITEVAPGQSIICVNGGVQGRASFLEAFPTVDPALVGYFEGAGFSGRGDLAILYTQDTQQHRSGVAKPVVLDNAWYPSQDDVVAGGATDGATWDVLNEAWNVEGVWGAFASKGTAPIDALGTMKPIIGSPGVASSQPCCYGLVVVVAIGLAKLGARV